MDFDDLKTENPKLSHIFNYLLEQNPTLIFFGGALLMTVICLHIVNMVSSN